MEEMNLLGLSNAVHLFALQYVFVPRMSVMMKAHNHHKIRTEGNKTPHML